MENSLLSLSKTEAEEMIETVVDDWVRWMERRAWRLPEMRPAQRAAGLARGLADSEIITRHFWNTLYYIHSKKLWPQVRAGRVQAEQGRGGRPWTLSITVH